MAKLTKNEIEDYKLNNVTRLVLYLAFVIIGFTLYNKSYIKLSTVERAFGITFIITGCIYVWMSSREKKIFLSNWDVIFGIISALSGLLLIINPGNVTNCIYLYFAIFLFSCFCQKLVVALKLFKAKDTAAKLTLVTSIFCLFLGVVCLFGPFNSMSINEQCGLYAIFYGIVQFANTVLLNDHEKAIIKHNK